MQRSENSSPKDLGKFFNLQAIRSLCMVMFLMEGNTHEKKIEEKQYEGFTKVIWPTALIGSVPNIDKLNKIKAKIPKSTFNFLNIFIQFIFYK